MKKPIALFLALLLAFSVTACGNDDMGSAGPALSASSLSPASLPASSPAGAEGTTVHRHVRAAGPGGGPGRVPAL